MGRESSGVNAGAGCLSVLVAVVFILYVAGDGCSKSARKADGDAAQEQASANERAAANDSINARQTLEGNLRAFALANTPELWRVLQQLKSLHQDTNQQLQKLQSALESVGRAAEQDVDYQRFGRKRNELAMMIRKLDNELQNAYIAYVKYETAPDSRTFSNQVAAAYQSGMQTAREATARYVELKNELSQ